MNPDPMKFVIDHWVAEDAGRFSAIGRCGDSPIHVEEVFDAVYSFQPRAYPEGLGDPPVLDEMKPVSLVVECIHAFGLSLPELGPCMTGRLVLKGNALQHVAPGWVLGRKGEG